MDLKEPKSDACMKELLGSTDVVGRSPLGCPLISQDCLELMLQTIGLTAYGITHQILYTSVAQLVPCSFPCPVLPKRRFNWGGAQVNCSSTLDAEIRKGFRRFRRRGLEGWRQEWCTNLLEEMKAGWQKRESKPLQRDLFLEQGKGPSGWGLVVSGPGLQSSRAVIWASASLPGATGWR